MRVKGGYLVLNNLSDSSVTKSRDTVVPKLTPHKLNHSHDTVNMLFLVVAYVQSPSS